jgi:arylsulfatase A-like enzyme
MGLAENTVVIYMGDNGMQWGTHDCHGIREPYEESIKLPLIVRAPWLIARAGTSRTQMVLNIDIAPTLLEIAGLSVPVEMDGASFIPILKNQETQGREAILLEFWRYFPENTPSYVGIRTGRYKYIQFERGRKPWLFNLEQDPKEARNLYGTPAGDRELPGLVKLMQELQPGDA